MPRTWDITGASRAGTSSGANFVATGRSVPVQAVPGVYYVSADLTRRATGTVSKSLRGGLSFYRRRHYWKLTVRDPARM